MFGVRSGSSTRIRVLIVTVDGVDERRLIVQRDSGHDVVVNAKAAGQQRFVIANEHHPRQHRLDAGHDELVHPLQEPGCEPQPRRRDGTRARHRRTARHSVLARIVTIAERIAAISSLVARSNAALVRPNSRYNRASNKSKGCGVEG